MNRPNWVGQMLGGRYRIDELIGQGGMSAVYKAYDPNLRRVVAIKMIHSHLASDMRFKLRFEEEAAAVAQLRHPNIVQVFDFNHDEDLYYMVQEFIPGETLQERLRRVNKSGKRLPLMDAIHITMNICDAAGYAHQRGLIHRDIKPANIMLDVHSQAILMDFGIVKIAGGEKHTASGAVVGTALYMPPEMIRGEAPDSRSDIYSLGVTLFEMVSGQPPFDADSAMSLMMQHLHEPVPDLRGLRPEVPDDLIAVIEKALTKSRLARFASMAEMSAGLKAVLDHLNSPISTAGQEGTLTTPEAATLKEEPVILPEAAIGTAALPLESIVPADALPESTPMPENPVLQASQSTQIEPSASLSMSPPLVATLLDAADGVPAGSPPAQHIAASPADTGGLPPNIPTSMPAAGRGNRRLPVIIGGVVLVLVIAMVAIFFLRSPGGGNQNLASSGNPTGTQALAALPVTQSPTATITLTPTITPTPPPTETPAPTFSPTPTIPVGVPYSLIRGITTNEEGRYIVEYETFEYTEEYPGTHVHFFFNTLPVEEAGHPGEGPWYLWGGPRPFDRARMVERPDDATQLCILVANPDHSVQPDTGNCFVLPDIVTATALHDTSCLLGPAPEYPPVTQITTSQVMLVHGLSSNELYWNVASPLNAGESCWVERQATGASGDISTLPLVEAPPLPTEAVPTGLSVQITAIDLDEQNHYVVAYVTEGFTEQMPGTHIHFFFNTVTPEELDAGGNLLMHGGPAPFTGYTRADRPAEAVQMCALVANPDHTVILESGNCFDLPDQ